MRRTLAELGSTFVRYWRGSPACHIVAAVAQRGAGIADMRFGRCSSPPLYRGLPLSAASFSIGYVLIGTRRMNSTKRGWSSSFKRMVVGASWEIIGRSAGNDVPNLGGEWEANVFVWRMHAFLQTRLGAGAAP